MTATVLVIEDEAPIRELIAVNLRHAGYASILAGDCASALREINRQLPDAVLLDWMLPDQPGLELARRLRADPRTRELPIIMLTARAHEQDKISGFDAGVDDYVTKPFSPREVLMRLRAVLRRASPSAGDEPIEIAGLRLEPRTHRATGNGAALELSPTEFKLLHFMMCQPDRVLARSRLLDGV
ncbi:MAG: response regulator, partial [Quisquiliibacterium sp.]